MGTKAGEKDNKHSGATGRERSPLPWNLVERLSSYICKSRTAAQFSFAVKAGCIENVTMK